MYLNFNSATEGSVNIQIVNSIGQLVKQHPVNTIKGHNQFKIQVADIRPGMYILRINKGDLNLTKKVCDRKMIGKNHVLYLTYVFTLKNFL